MEQINTQELSDPSLYPDEALLMRVLGDAHAAYRDMLGMFAVHGLTHEWRYYRDGKAWLCKVQKGKRTIIWMSAWKGFMQATVYFPEKYADGLWKLDLKEETKEKFRTVKRVGKSTPCTFEVREKGTLAELETVVRYKIAMK